MSRPRQAAVLPNVRRVSSRAPIARPHTAPHSHHSHRPHTADSFSFLGSLEHRVVRLALHAGNIQKNLKSGVC